MRANDVGDPEAKLTAASGDDRSARCAALVGAVSESTMSSSNYWPRPPQAGFDERFERLRRGYIERLSSDRGKLAALTNELSLPERHLTPVLEEIRMLAHRIGGSAALFEHLTVRNAAVALERAALRAVSSASFPDQARLREIIEELMQLLPPLRP